MPLITSGTFNPPPLPPDWSIWDGTNDGPNTLDPDFHSIGAISSCIVQLGSDRVFEVSDYDPNAAREVFAKVRSVTGTSVSMGTRASLDATIGSINPGTLVSTLIDTDKVLVVYANIITAPNRPLTAVVCTISGQTITPGTPVVLSANSSTFVCPGLHTIGTDKAVLVYAQNTSNDTDAHVITVSGTTPTLNAKTTIDTDRAPSGFMSSLVDGRTLVAYGVTTGGTNYTYFEILSVSGTTVSSDAKFTGFTGTGSNIEEIHSLQHLGDNDFAYLYRLSPGNNLYLRQVHIGTGPDSYSTGPAVEVQSGGDQVKWPASVAALEDKQVMVTWTGNSTDIPRARVYQMQGSPAPTAVSSQVTLDSDANADENQAHYLGGGRTYLSWSKGNISGSPDDSWKRVVRISQA